jgi:hypothetical protein
MITCDIEASEKDPLPERMTHCVVYYPPILRVVDTTIFCVLHTHTHLVFQVDLDFPPVQINRFYCVWSEK